MKQKFINLYMDWATRVAQLSYARRLQVGAVIVKDDCVISYGYNGTPAGWDNNCEDEIPVSPRSAELPEELDNTYTLKTRPEVLHAEMNALMKLAKTNGSGNNASLFVTHAPCLECAKGIYQAGISEVYYGEDYRSEDGIYFLNKCGITIQKVFNK
jgi:dCMP deaminase